MLNGCCSALSMNSGPPPQSPDQWLRKEDDSISFGIEPEHRMTMRTLRMHQHRLTQPPPVFPQKPPEQIKSLLPCNSRRSTSESISSSE